MNELEVHKTQALWYAWGQMDAGTVLAGDVFDFAEQYQARYRAFKETPGLGMSSLQDAFALWQTGAKLMTESQRLTQRHGNCVYCNRYDHACGRPHTSVTAGDWCTDPVYPVDTESQEGN